MPDDPSDALPDARSDDLGHPLRLPDDSAGPRDRFLWAIVLLVLAFLAYAPALHGQFLWDDDRHISENVMLRTPDGLARIWTELGATPQYYPLTHTLFWIEYHLWGLETTGYHAVNIALHALGAIFLWWILRRLEVPGAWLIAAIFTLHPMQVESVAWITERKNTLAGCLFFGSILAYLRFADIGPKPVPLDAIEATEPGATPIAWPWCALALLLFTGAALSKTVAVSMPAVVVLLLWWKRRLTIPHALLLVPFFAIGLTLSRITAWMEIHTVGAEGPDWAFTFAQRTLIAGRAMGFYVGKILWPTNLSFFYRQWALDTGSAGAWVWPIASALALVGLAIGARRRRGPLVAALIFVGCLTPALGFFDVYPMRFSFVADHFQYLPEPAFVAGVIGGAIWLIRRHTALPDRPAWRIASATVAGGIVIALGLSTWSRAHVFASDTRLWQDTLAKNPDAWLASFNLAVTYNNRAVESTQQASAIQSARPDAATALRAAAERDRAEAETLLRKTIALKPSMARAHQILGEILAQTGRAPEALVELDAAIAADPDWYGSYRSRGTLCEMMGNLDAAADDYTRAIAAYQAARNKAIARSGSFFAAREMHAAFARPHLELGVIRAKQNRLDDALRNYNDALAIRPGWSDALLERGLVFARMGRPAEALNDLRAVAAQRPDDPKVWTVMGYVLLDAKRPDIAADVFARALQLDPTNPRARAGLDTARRTTPDTAPATAPAAVPRSATTAHATIPTAPTAPATTLPATAPAVMIPAAP